MHKMISICLFRSLILILFYSDLNSYIFSFQFRTRNNYNHPTCNNTIFVPSKNWSYKIICYIPILLFMVYYFFKLQLVLGLISGLAFDYYAFAKLIKLFSKHIIETVNKFSLFFLLLKNKEQKG